MRRLFLAALLFGCSSNPTTSPDVPDTRYNPGPTRPGGYGSGSGGGSTTTPSPMPECEESLRRCAQPFSYAGKGDEKSVEVRGSFDGWGAGVAMALEGGAWRATVAVPRSADTQYKFRVIDAAGKEAWVADPANPSTVDDGQGGKNSILAAPMCATFSCADPVIAPSTYDWRDAVLYFVLVDRFLDGSAANNKTTSGVKEAANFRGGDWAGVLQKINDGWFTQLGVNALWLSVPLDNTEASGIGDDGELYSAYHGYWPRDLTKPDARLGSVDELKALVEAAHAKKIKVLIDYAMNHVHKDSPVYQAHQDWFHPLMQGGQECVCGVGACGWESQYKTSCWFRNYLPDFNFANPDARKFSVDNALYWMKTFGFDGLRLDAVKHIELSWLTDLRARLTSEIETTTKQHVYLVGETFTGDPGTIKTFVNPATMLDGQFDFPLRHNLVSKVLLRQGSMRELSDFMNGNTAYYGNSAVMSTFVGNHDVPRSIHFAEDAPLWSDAWANGKDRNWSNQPGVVGGTNAYERLALAMAIVMTNRGVPLLYYGDEIGLPGAGDPDNRRMMQWSTLSTGQQLLFDRTKALGAARAAHPALRRGTRTTLSVDTDVWLYKMVDGADTVYVALNRSDGEKSVGGLPSGALQDLFNATSVTGPTVNVPARGARILVTP